MAGFDLFTCLRLKISVVSNKAADDSTVGDEKSLTILAVCVVGAILGSTYNIHLSTVERTCNTVGKLA